VPFPLLRNRHQFRSHGTGRAQGYAAAVAALDAVENTPDPNALSGTDKEPIGRAVGQAGGMLAGVRGVRSGSSTRRRFETYERTETSAQSGRSSPQSASMMASSVTARPALSASSVSSARWRIVQASTSCRRARLSSVRATRCSPPCRRGTGRASARANPSARGSSIRRHGDPM
jgi:hypothetical protein